MSLSIEEQLRVAIESSISDSHAEVHSRGKHFSISVVSPKFSGKSILNSHRLVHSSIKTFMSGADAPVHAIDELKTSAP